MKRGKRSILGALSAAIMLCAGSAFAAGQKSGGNFTLADDFAAGMAVSTDAAGGNFWMQGNLGQTSVSSRTASAFILEGGFQSKLATVPVTIDWAGVYTTSICVAWTNASPANPAGTFYYVELATAADFTGQVFENGDTYTFSSTFTNLNPGTDYFGRVLVGYTSGFFTGWKSIPTSTTTVPDPPRPSWPADGVYVSTHPNFMWVGPSTTTLESLGAGTSYFLEVDDHEGFATPLISISTPAFIDNHGVKDDDSVYFSSEEFLADTTYYWRVRWRDPGGEFGDWSAVRSFRTDYADPFLTGGGFRSVSSTGGFVSESRWGDLAGGVTVQMPVQDDHAGLLNSTVTVPDSYRTAPGGFGILFSSDSGGSWHSDAGALNFNPGAHNRTASLLEFNGRLYAGFAGTGDEGDLYVCDPGGGSDPDKCESGEWTLSYDPGATFEGVFAQAEFNGRLYVGLGQNSGDGDIMVCDPDGGGSDPAVCEPGEWSSAYANTAGYSIRAMAAYGGKLYAGQAGTGGLGDVLVCDPGVSGDPAVCETADWSVSFDAQGTVTGIWSLAVFNGVLYAGQEGASTEGDILAFDGSEWTRSFNGANEGVFALTVYDGELWAADGENIGGFIWRFDGRNWRQDGRQLEEGVYSLTPHQGKLYAGIGNTDGDADVYVSTGGNWHLAYETGGTENGIYALASFGGELFAGTANDDQEGDVHVLKPLGVPSLTGAEGSTSQEVLSVVADLIMSSSTLTCGGASAPCGATNQVKLIVTDRAGRVQASEPYAVLVDTRAAAWCVPFNSSRSGRWADGTVWDQGYPPTACNQADVQQGHEVEIDITTATAGRTRVSGTLKFSRTANSSFTLASDDLDVQAGGTLDMGTESEPIPAGVDAHLILGYGTFGGQYGLSVNNGGNFSVRGATKTPATTVPANTANDLSLGGNTATLSDDPTVMGWEVDDVVTFSPTHSEGSLHRATITFISGNDITVSPSFGSHFYATGPIHVANLSRNALVRSSSTYGAGRQAFVQNSVKNSTSFYVNYGEFAYLGANLLGKYGLTFSGADVRGSVSSSTVRDGYIGLYVDAASSNTFTYNLLHGMAHDGVRLVNSAKGSTITWNHVFGNQENGLHFMQNASSHTADRNRIYSNGWDGIRTLSGADYNLFRYNDIFQHGNYGASLESTGTVMANNTITRSIWAGIRHGAGRRSVFYANDVSSSGACGLAYENNAGRLTSVSNVMYGNSPAGLCLYGGEGGTFLLDVLYSNAKGVYVTAGDHNDLTDLRLGYEPDDTPAQNGSAEVDLAGGSPMILDMQGTKINPAVGISTDGIDAEGVALVSNNQDGVSGEIRLWGDIQLEGGDSEGVEFDYSEPLYEPESDSAVLVRGEGHWAYASSDTVTAANAVSELISMEFRGGQWHVDGSVSGPDMRVFTGNQTDLPVPSASPQFYLTFTEGGSGSEEGDLLYMAYAKGSQDSDVQKKVLFGPSAASFRGGKSRLTVVEFSSMRLRGVENAPTIVDVIPGSTYYTVISSGFFSATHTVIMNMDREGLQFGGANGHVNLSSVTLDFLGVTVDGEPHAYITARSLTSEATFYNVTFSTSRSLDGMPFNNVSVTGIGNLGWKFYGAGMRLGPVWGMSYENDPGAQVAWEDVSCSPLESARSGPWSDAETWSLGFVPGDCNNVTIADNDTVTVDITTATAGGIALTGPEGTLKFSRVTSSTLTVISSDVVVYAGGHLDMGDLDASDRIPTGVQAQLNLASGTSAGQYGLIVYDGGDFTVYGEDKGPASHAVQTSDLGSGDDLITLEDDPAGSLNWAIGDQVVIGPTQLTGPNVAEFRTISGLPGGNQIEVTPALSRVHYGTGSIRVANMTRNVIVRSSGTDYTANTSYIRNLTKFTTSFSLVEGEFAYLGANSPKKYGIYVDGTDVKAFVSSSSIRDGYYGMYVYRASTITIENTVFGDPGSRGIYLDTTYNNLISSNDFVGGSGDAIYVFYGATNAFVNNHVYSHGTEGMEFWRSDSNRVIANTVRSNGNGGIVLNESSSNTVSWNRIYHSGAESILAFKSSSNTLEGNLIKYGGAGISLAQSQRTRLMDNDLWENFDTANGAIYLSQANGNVLTGNRCSNNRNTGIYLTNSHRNYVFGSALWSNRDNAIYVGNSQFNTFELNYASGTTAGGRGFYVGSSPKSILARNYVFSNFSYGVDIDGSDNVLMFGNKIYSNSGNGIRVQAAADAIMADDRLGYRDNETAAANTGGEISLGVTALPTNLTLLRVRVNDTDAIDESTLDAVDKFVTSYNHSFDTGTLRFWGSATVQAGSTLTLKYSDLVNTSTVPYMNTLQGAGFTVSVDTDAASEPNAISQLIKMVYKSNGNWMVSGSSSGFMRSVTHPANDIPIPNIDPQFYLKTGGSPEAGYTVHFPFTAGTKDQNTQKKLLIGTGGGSFNNQQSKLAIAPGSGIWLEGIDEYPTVVDRLDGAATYYMLVASGAFTAIRSSITNMDNAGIWLDAYEGVEIATTTFDYLGVTVAGEPHAYLRASENSGGLDTFYGVGFENSRSTENVTAYNVQADNGSAANWTFRKWKGPMGGSPYEDEGGGSADFSWTPFEPSSAVSTFTGVFLTSVTANWDIGNNDPGFIYHLEACESAGCPSVYASSVTYNVSATVSNPALKANTTYWFEAFGEDPPGYGFSPHLNLTSTATLALAPGALAESVYNVWTTSVGVAWAALADSPQEATSEGYVLEASSDVNFGLSDPGAVLHSSATPSVFTSTLAVGWGTSMLANTTYYFRAGSLNWNRMPNYGVYLTTPTLAKPASKHTAPDVTFQKVWLTSVTVAWQARPDSPQTDTCEGYVVEASSTDFGSYLPGGVIYSSRTRELNASTLTITNLTMNVTYFFRVGTLNWSDAPNYTFLGSTNPAQFKKVYEGGGYSTFGSAWGDIDNDDLLDFISATGGAELDRIFRNNGDGTFTQNSVGNSDPNVGVAWADYDNDGDMDYAAAGSGTAPDYIGRNDGGTFNDMSITGAPAVNSAGVAWGDYDNDGDLDLVFNGDTPYIARNDGGVFSTFTVTGGAGSGMGVAWGDYDDDGDLDIAFARAASGVNHILRNDGGGSFYKLDLTGTTEDTVGIGWGDYNGDGKLDVWMANTGADDCVMRNDGGDSFTKITINDTDVTTWGLSIADYDNDGDLDAAYSVKDGGDEYIAVSNGVSFSTIGLAGSGGDSRGISWGDYDSDGDLDLLVGNWQGDDYILRNEATVFNTAPSSPSAGSFWGSFTEFSEFSSSGFVRLAWPDFWDLETPQDLLGYIVKIGTASSGIYDFLKSPDPYGEDGYSGGSFIYSTKIGSQRVIKVTMQKETTAYWKVFAYDGNFRGSVDTAEKYADFIAPNPISDLQATAIMSTGLGASSMTVSLTWTAPGEDSDVGNITSGEFEIRWSTTAPIDTNQAFVDVPVENRLSWSTDTVQGVVQSTDIPYLNAAATHYFAITTKDSVGVRSPLSNYTTALSYIQTIGSVGDQKSSLAWGDYDNDGDMDLAVAKVSGQIRILRNDGALDFYGFNLPTGGNYWGLAWGDYDGDGDLDLAAAVGATANEAIYTNLGADTFSRSEIIGSAGDSTGVSWGDCDNDGDLDLAISNASGQSEKVARNDGGGVWSVLDLGTAGTSYEPVWGDYDNDGDLDLAVANWAIKDYVLRNDGHCSFTVLQPSGLTFSAMGAAWGDHDNDGDLDLMFSNASGGNELLMSNDGDGSFTDVVVNSGGDNRGLEWGDYDNDGDLDALIGGRGTDRDAVLRNDGGATFAKIPLGGTLGGVMDIDWVDVDQDGDLDGSPLYWDASQDAYILRNDSPTVNAVPSIPSLDGADFQLDYDLVSSTFVVKWPGGDYDNKGDSDTVHYALAVATESFALDAGNQRLITTPARFVLPWNYGSPQLGNYSRPAYKDWGDGTPMHGLILRVDTPTVATANLASDTTYYMRLQAIDFGLARSSWGTEVSTYVYTYVPPSGRNVADVWESSITVSFNSPPRGSKFFLQADDDQGFGSINASSETTNSGVTSLTVSGLSENSTYYLRMGTLWIRTTSYAMTVPASTFTLADEPSPGAPSFPSATIFVTSMTANWVANSNPNGTTYEVLLASVPYSPGIANVTITTAPESSVEGTLTGLLGNENYYGYVRAVNRNGVPTNWIDLGTAATEIAEPTQVFADRVSSTTLVVSAYAPAGGLANLNTGNSGTDLSITPGGGYTGSWHQSTWTYVADMTTARHGLAVAVEDGLVHAIGGDDGGTAQSANEAYNPGTGAWSTLDALAPARKYPAAAASRGNIYVFGGAVAGVLNTNQEYDRDQDQWAGKTPMSVARADAVAGEINGKIYVIGGNDDSGPPDALGENAEYDPDTDQWTGKQAMVPAADAAAGAVFNDKLYIFGGQDDNPVTVYYSTAVVYDPGGGWSDVADMTVQATELAAESVGGKIYVMGGRNASGELRVSVEYDPASDTWADALPMNSTRTYAAAGAVDGVIYLIGGKQGGTSLTTVEAFDPGVTKVFSNLTPNTQYQIRAKARNRAGTETSESPILWQRTYAAEPSTATPGFSTVEVGSMTVNWTDNTNPVGVYYWVDASTDAGFTGTGDLATGWVQGLSPTISSTVYSMSVNTTYYFRAKARNNDLVETQYVVLGATSTASSMPSNPGFAGVFQSSISVFWGSGDDPNPGDTLYELMVDDNAAFSTPQSTFTTSLNVSAVSLAANTTYYLRLRSYNRQSVPSPWTPTGSTSTLTLQPTGVDIIQVFNTSMTVNWGNVSSQGYLLEASSTSFDGTGTVYSTSTDDGGQTSMMIDGLEGNTTYQVRIGALNWNLVPHFLTGGSSATLADVVGGAQLYDVGSTSVTWNWVPLPSSPQAATAEGYTLEASTDEAFGGTLHSSITATGVEPSTLTVMGLTGWTTYYFRVGSLNLAGATSYLTVGSTFTLAPPPGDPLVAEVFRSSISVTWTGVDPNQAYILAASTAADFSGTVLASQTYNTSMTGLTVESLSLNTTYYLKAGAVWSGATFYATVTPVSTATLAAQPIPAFETWNEVWPSSISVLWDPNSNPPDITRYGLILSTASPLEEAAADNVFVTTTPAGAPLQAELGGLTADTTYYFYARAVNHSSIPTNYTVFGSTPTLAVTPDAPSIQEIYVSSGRVSWGAVAGQGYLLQAAQDAGFTIGMRSSSTANENSDTLWATAFSAPNTTYYFRVGSLNHHGLPNFVDAGSLSTLADPVSGAQFDRAHITSVTANWAELPSAPQWASAEGYRLDASTTASFDTVATSITAGVVPSTLTVDGLDGGTTYYFRVGSLNLNDAPNYVFIGSTFTLAPAPESPAITDAFESSITVSWGAWPDALGYVLEASVNSEFDAISFASETKNPLSTVLTVQALSSNASYYMRVGALWSDTTYYALTTPISTATLVREPIAAAPPFLSVDVSSVNFQWDPNGNGEGTDFVAEISTDAFQTINVSSVTRSTFTIFGNTGEGEDLTPNSTYYYRVHAVNIIGATTPFTPTVSTMTLAAMPGMGSPPFPVLEHSSAAFQWTSAQNPSGATRYVAEVSANDPDFTTVDYTSSTYEFSALFGDTGEGPSMDSNTTYYFRVAAYNSHGLRSTWSVVQVTATWVEEPLIPASTFTTVGVTSMTYEWNAGGNPGGTLYKVDVTTDDGASVNFTSYTFNSSVLFGFGGAWPDLVADTTYAYRVAAIGHNGGMTNYKVHAETATWPAQPASASLPFATVDLTSITFQWDKQGNPGDTPHEAEISNNDFGSVYSASVTLESFALFGDTGQLPALVPNTTYYFHVRGRGRLGAETGWGAYGSTATLAAPPVPGGTPFTVAGVGVSSVTFEWSDGTNPLGTLYEAQVSTDAFGSVNASSFTRNQNGLFGTGGTGETLTGNTTYYFQVRAVNHSGIPSAFDAVDSTATPAAVPDTFSFPVVGLSSAAFQWGDGGNRAGTVYLAEISDDDFAGGPDVSSTTVETTAIFGTGGEGPALTQNTTYYFRVAVVDMFGRQSGFAVTLPTVTLVNPPAPLSEPADFPTVDLSSIAFAWGQNGNPVGTEYVAELSTAPDFTGVDTTSVTYETSALFGTTGEGPALSLNTTYYLRVAARNRAGALTDYTAVKATATHVILPASGSPVFPRVDYRAIHFRWGPDGNPDGTDYVVDMAKEDETFFTIDRSSATKSTTAVFGYGGLGADLVNSTTYYFRVKAVGIGGYETPWTTIEYSTPTLPGDIVPPSVTDNQTGDDVWRSNSSATYDVDLYDTGGAGLDKLQVKVSTSLGGAGTYLIESSDVVSGIGADEYLTDWSLPGGVWGELLEAATNYITLILHDLDGNTTTYYDAFYVKKDTTAPVFVNSEAGGDSTPRRTQRAYDVDVLDPASGIDKFEYSVSTDAGAGDEGWIAWADLGVTAGATEYLTDWNIDFASLDTDATYYVSIRAWDLAGATRTVVDAFYVMKDTVGPTVEITLPASAFRSSLGTISGTAADFMNVKGTSVSFKEVGGNYWNGTNFTGLSPKWYAASGTTDWTISPGIPWVNGTEYEIVARSSDTADNLSSTYSTATFTLDQSTPTALVVTPVPDSEVSSLLQITGTADDPDPTNSGISAVKLQLRRLSDQQYWDFFNDQWSGTAVSTVAVGAATWIYTVPDLLRANLANNASYFIEVQAADNAQPPNEADFLVYGATFTFVDVSSPAAVTSLSALAGANPGELQLNWTAPGDDDSSGPILLGEYRIQYATFTAASFSTTTAQQVISTGPVFPSEAQGYTFTGLDAGTTYYLHVWTQDDAGNWSPLSNQATAQATPAPTSEIHGHVVKVSSEGITAVLVEAYDDDGVQVSQTYTLDDGSGSFTLEGLVTGTYKVQATWTADEITSSVWVDGIAMGSVNVDFVLEINYTLSTLTGTLATLATGAAGPSGTSSAFVAQAAKDGYEDSRVELFQKGRKVAETQVQPTGRWRIAGLLPGKYAVRAYNGFEYTKEQDVELLEGEVREVSFVFDPLPDESVFAFPNPAHGPLTFRFMSPLSPLEAQVLIFDIAGDLVRELTGNEMSSPSPGLYHAAWDLKNSQGDDVASGVYLFMVKVKGANGQAGKVIKKVAVVR